MDQGAYETLLLERSAAVLRVTLDRPARLNALSPQLLAELERLLATVAVDPEVRVLVIRGAGKGFCSGYDVAPTGDLGDDEKPLSPLARLQAAGADSSVFDRLWRLPIPTIAQIHGHCLAGGTDLALSCDFVVCAEDATIGYPAVRSMGVPATHMWLYHLGPQWTKRLLLTGDSIRGAKAAEIGFALEAVPAEQLDDRVGRLAERLSWVQRDLLALSKQVVNRGLDLMGRTLLQETAVERDMLSRLAPGAGGFMETAARAGVKQAIAERDAPFRAEDPIS
jgi:enoyl-CoA hydratase